MKVAHGITRTALVFRWFVVKIPVLTRHHHFLQGCHSNWMERRYTRQFCDAVPDYYEKIAPCYFCSWFGLFSVMARCQELNRELTVAEKYRFRGITTDIKGYNFGIYQTRLVCFDYA